MICKCERALSIRIAALLLSSLFLVALAACAGRTSSSTRLKVVATTNVLGDVVAQVGADLIDLTVLLPVATDPHGFQPTPRDLAAVEAADLVFVNGLGLEEFLVDMVEAAGSSEQLVLVSQGMAVIEVTDEHDHENTSADPHVWLDPQNVSLWVDTIAAAMASRDAEHAAAFTVNADAYKQELEVLDQWAQAEIGRIPAEKRVLVTDHNTLAYFASRYGFELVGTVIPGASSLAEPAAAELAELEERIDELGVAAIFVGTSVNQEVARRVAEDSGIRLVTLYTGSLSDAEGPAASYLEMMRYNVNAIVGALQ